MSVDPLSVLDQLNADLDALAGRIAAGVDAERLVELLHRFEAFRNRLSVVDHLLVQQVAVHSLAEKYCMASIARLLVATLRISPGEAGRRVRAAEAVGPRASMLRETLPPKFPVLAAAQAAGEVSAEQLAVVERALSRVELFAPSQLPRAELDLVGYAKVFDPLELRKVAARLVDAVDPDGSRPRDLVNADLRYLALSTGRDGMLRLEGRLTPAVGAQLAAVLSPLARPRQTVEVGPQGGERPVPDDRSYQQRLHDALGEACGRLLRSGLPVAGGIPATVIVTLTVDQLLTRTGLAETSTGTLLSVPEMLKLAAEAEILPAVLTSRGKPLHLGRSRRLASAAQTYALHARDGGCSFPGCSVRPEWCEKHHVVEWAAGGRTDLDNLTLLCGYHHAHYATAGWTCTLKDGLPWWRPPQRWRPDAQPLLNHRIRQRHHPRN